MIYDYDVLALIVIGSFVIAVSWYFIKFDRRARGEVVTNHDPKFCEECATLKYRKGGS